MVRRSQNAFFNSRPRHLLPVPDRLLITFQRPPDRTLASPAKFAQDAPDVVLVVAHPAKLLDEAAYPTGGPQSADKAARLGPALERALKRTQLRRAELCRTAGACGLAQTPQPRFAQLPRPAADRLPMYAHRTRHLRLTEPLAQQARRLQPSPFQGFEVPPHSCWITHASILAELGCLVTILCRNQ